MLVDTYDLYLRYLLIDTNDIYQITDQGLSLLTILGRYGEGTNYLYGLEGIEGIHQREER